jgi:DNA-binding FadR family transcriptional regulator
MTTRTTITAARLRHDAAQDSAPSPAPAFRVPKTAELVADHIRKMIIRGELRPGDYLQPEAQLIERFATSRATIREAFRILEAEQFLSVTRGSRSGAQVHLPDAATPARYAGFVLQAQGTTLADIYLVRAANEPYAAWLLARRQSPEDVATLRAELAKAEKLQAAGEFEAYRTALARFHRLIVDLTGSNSLRLVIAMIHDLIERHQARRDDRGRTAEDCYHLKSFWKLTDFIERGEADKAQAHWRQHVQTTNEAWLAGDDTRLVDLLD